MKKTISQLNTPLKIQKFIDALEYNTGKRISIKQAIEEKKGDCLEAACLASHILTKHKIPNFIMDLTSVRDEDHVICVYREKGLYGAIAQSKFLGLRYRNPVYKTLRELAMSYFENYFNYYGEHTLRGYGEPLRINFEKHIDDAKKIIEIEQKLNEIKHHALVPKNIKLPRVTTLKFNQELIIRTKNAKYGKKYTKKIKSNNQ